MTPIVLRSSSALLIALVLAPVALAARSASGSADELALVELGRDHVLFHPRSEAHGLALSVATPSGEVVEQRFPAGSAAGFWLSGGAWGDGLFAWELRALRSSERPGAERDGRSTHPATHPAAATSVQRGTFRVEHGLVFGSDLGLGPGLETLGGPDATVVFEEDVVMRSNLCVGRGCTNAEGHDADVLRLKQDVLRVHFDDTSVQAGAPANDWRIAVNDGFAGGADYFAIDDVTTDARPFVIEAGAPGSTLHVDSTGRVGVGTSTPASALHAKQADTPTVRLEQDGTGGFAPATWDVGGNEEDFFVRDGATNNRPLSIQAGALDDSLVISGNGGVGVGTAEPDSPFTLQTENRNARIKLIRKDDAGPDSVGLFTAARRVFSIGSISEHPVQFVTGDSGGGSSWKLKVHPDRSLETSTGAMCTPGGVWMNNASLSSQRGVRPLGTDDALAALEELQPVRFRYASDPGREHVGFTAERAPDLVTDGACMSPMDVTAVLTRVVQEQQRRIAEQDARLADQERRLRRLERALAGRGRR